MSKHKIWLVNDHEMEGHELNSACSYSLLPSADRITLRDALDFSPLLICALLPAADLAGAWVLLIPEYNAWGMRVNGMLVPAGIRMLRHKDVVLIRPGRELIYSAENIVSAPFAGDPSYCFRCHDPLYEGDGTLVVYCPRCQAPHHEQCWVHTAKCGTPFCQMQTRQSWDPEVRR